jgi:two-component system, response regulator YesN
MGTKTNIMIIDDSYTNRVLFKAILEDLDINVTEVHSGLKALKILDDVNPDIILLDMCMPMMTGIDFLKELKALNRTTPVIVVSVLDDQLYIKQAFQYGASDYLVKPVEVDELIRRISRYTECEFTM